MILIRGLGDRLLAYSESIGYNSRGNSFGVRIGCLTIGCLGVVTAAFAITDIPYGRAIWDFLFILDGAYRISLGQIPHVDFASPVGSLSLYLAAAASRLFPGGNAFVGLHALAWLLVMAPFAVLVPRFRSARAFYAALTFLAVIMLIPITVDDTILSEISYFATYNRFATGFLFVSGLWLVLPKARHDWLLLAYLLAVLFFLKFTAAVVLLGIIAAAVILGRWRLAQALAAITVFIVALIFVEFLSGGMVAGYLHDISTMSRINSRAALHGLFYASYRNWTTLLAAAIFALAVLGARLSPPQPLRSGWRDIIASIWRNETFALDAALLIAAALLAESQNSGGLGLIAAAALFFHPGAWHGGKARIAMVSFLLAAMTLPVIGTAFDRVLTVAIRQTRQIAHNEAEQLFPGTTVTGPTIAAARLFKRINAEWPDFARQLEADGFALERDPGSNAPGGMLAWITSAVEAGRIFEEKNYGARSQHYATLAFVDPFARMLKLTPALHTTIVMDIGRTFPLLTAQEADAYLVTADGVFVSRCERRTLANNDTAFQAVFEREFEKLPLNECWEFYRRTSGPL